MTRSLPTQQRRILVFLIIITRFLTGALIYLSSCLPSFDAAHELVTSGKSHETFVARWASSMLRWDAFHFAHIAKHGYLYEYEFAFFPGLPFVMRMMALLGKLVPWFPALEAKGELHPFLVGGAIAAAICDSTLDLYSLTLLLTKSTQFAFLTTLSSLISTAPAVLFHGSYTEPFFAFFSIKGMLFCEKKRWFPAAFCFAVATAFRSNGILLSGYLIWGLVVLPALKRSRISFKAIAYSTTLAIFSTLPFVAHQFHAYQSFCSGHRGAPIPEWCYRNIPMIYSYVQGKYWNVGFLKYWTLSQIPNFALAAPVLVLLFHSSVSHIITILKGVFIGLEPSVSVFKRLNQSPSRSVGTLPYALHALAVSLILLFASHTQIALRMAPSIPFSYWAIASLFIERPRAARVWMAWNIVWWAVSCVLWGVFLPPA